jgi:hypothetical protein
VKKMLHWQTLANICNQKLKALLTIPKSLWWLVKWPFKIILSGLIRCAIKHPAIKVGIGAWLKKYPSLFTHSLMFARARGINIDATLPTDSQELPQPLVRQNTPDLTKLTPHARRIYIDLKDAMDRNNKENS